MSSGGLSLFFSIIFRSQSKPTSYTFFRFIPMKSEQRTDEDKTKIKKKTKNNPKNESIVRILIFPEITSGSKTRKIVLADGKCNSSHRCRNFWMLRNTFASLGYGGTPWKAGVYLYSGRKSLFSERHGLTPNRRDTLLWIAFSAGTKQIDARPFTQSHAKIRRRMSKLFCFRLWSRENFSGGVIFCRVERGIGFSTCRTTVWNSLIYSNAVGFTSTYLTAKMCLRFYYIKIDSNSYKCLFSLNQFSPKCYFMELDNGFIL